MEAWQALTTWPGVMLPLYLLLWAFVIYGVVRVVNYLDKKWFGMDAKW